VRYGTDNLQIQVRYLIPSVIGLILISIGYRCYASDYFPIQVRYLLLSDTGAVLITIVDTGLVLITFRCRSGFYTDYLLIQM